MHRVCACCFFFFFFERGFVSTPTLVPSFFYIFSCVNREYISSFSDGGKHGNVLDPKGALDIFLALIFLLPSEASLFRESIPGKHRVGEMLQEFI